MRTSSTYSVLLFSIALHSDINSKYANPYLYLLTKIADTEKEYNENRYKREKRLKERIENLQKEFQELKG